MLGQFALDALVSQSVAIFEMIIVVLHLLVIDHQCRVVNNTVAVSQSESEKAIQIMVGVRLRINVELD